MDREIKKEAFGVKVQFNRERKMVELVYPDGRKVNIPVPETHTRMTNTERLALAVINAYGVVAAFPDETSVGDQQSHQVDSLESIEDLPHHAEAFAPEAIKWAGSVLQAKRWSASQVTDIVFNSNKLIITGLSLGSLDPKVVAEHRRVFEEFLVTRCFPGSSASHERSLKGKLG